MTEKNKVATISAADVELVGCPLPASVVSRMLSILRFAALLASTVSNASSVIRTVMVCSLTKRGDCLIGCNKHQRGRQSRVNCVRRGGKVLAAGRRITV